MHPRRVPSAIDVRLSVGGREGDARMPFNKSGIRFARVLHDCNVCGHAGSSKPRVDSMERTFGLKYDKHAVAFCPAAFKVANIPDSVFPCILCLRPAASW